MLAFPGGPPRQVSWDRRTQTVARCWGPERIETGWWRGPDVRDRALLAHGDDGTWQTAWPPNGGNVGPCKDADVCRALRLLGSASPTARRTAVAKGR